VADAEKVVLKAIRKLAKRRKSSLADLDRDSELFDELKLDSLDAAELSAMLEEDLGSDPYSEGLTPRTVGDVLEFYEKD
jgi:acyl carrier protein